MKKLLATAIATLLFCNFAHAVRLQQPYAVDVAVVSQSSEDRAIATRTGLLLVLEKLGGQRLDGNAQIVATQNKADAFLAQFSYQQNASVEGAAPSWILHLVFEQTAVDRVLHDAGIPVWPLDRPQVLLLAVDGQNHWLPAADDANQMAAIKRIGMTRGVPLLLPNASMNDITTTASVQSLDTAALMAQAIQQGANVLLLGNINGSDEKGWSGQWALRIGEQEQRFAEKAPTLIALTDAAVRHAADILSTSYRSATSTDTGSTSLRLQVDGVNSYAAFMQLRQYLEKLAAVDHIDGTHINGTSVVVDLKVKGRESFRNLFGLFKSVQWQEEVPSSSQSSDAAAVPVWRYRWVD